MSISVTRSTKRPAEVPSADEIRALINGCSTRAPTGVRNRALILVMWQGGLRIGEALALRPADVNGADVRVLHGKGDKARTVALAPEAAGGLALWMARRKQLGFNGRQRLFCTLDGGEIAQAYVRGLLRRLTLKAGLERERLIHPHMLRHAHAVGLARSGGSAANIQKSLGHASLAVTDRYLAGLGDEDALKAQREMEW